MEQELLAQLKEVLPVMKKLKDDMDGVKATSEEAKAFKSRIDKLEGDLVTVGAKFTELVNLQRTKSIVGDKLDEEQQIDFIKFAIHVMKHGLSHNTASEKAIAEIQAKYPGRKTGVVMGETTGTPTGSEGGYIIPPLFSKFIWRASLQASVALQEATQMPLTKGYKLPLSRISNDVAVYWETEGSDISSHYSVPTLTQDNLTAKKLMGHVVINNELIEDEPEELMDENGSTTLVDWLVNLFGEAIGQEIDKQAFQGTGTTFTGVLYTTGVNKVIMAHGKGSFDDASFDDFSNMISKLRISQLAGAKFYLSRSMLHVVRTLKDNYGRYLWQAASEGEPATIWGFPYRVCEQMPEVSASAVSTPFMFFGNMKKYAIGTKGPMTMRLDQSIKSFNDQSVLFVRRRIALVTALPAAFTVLATNSTET